MEKYVSIMEQKLKVPHEDHSFISSSISSAPTSLRIDMYTRKTRDDGDLHFRISCVSSSVMNLTSFAIERTD